MIARSQGYWSSSVWSTPIGLLFDDGEALISVFVRYAGWPIRPVRR